MNLRPYQQNAVTFLADKPRAFIVSPAGSGKTIMAAAAAKRRFPERANITWLANTREQVEQAQAAAAKFDLSISAHCVAAQPDCSNADLVIVDEAHHMPAASWASTIGAARGIVWGFSATPWSGDPDRDQQLREFFDKFHVVPRAEVMAGGSITEGRVLIHDLDRDGEFDAQIDQLTAEETIRRCRRFPFISAEEHERRARWQFTAEAVRASLVRNSRIVDIANESTGTVLVLVGTIEHGKLLEGFIRDSQLVHAKIAKSKRRAAIEAFRDGTLRCMIATSLADEGLDVPRASVLVLASGGRSPGKLEQRAGRVMRPHAEKEFGTVHDFADRGAGLARSQFFARYKTYKKLGYTIEKAL